MVDIKYSGDMIFWNYVLVKRKAKDFKQSDVKRILDKGYARAYIENSLK